MKRTRIAGVCHEFLLLAGCASTPSASTSASGAAAPASPEAAAVALSDASVATQMETFPEWGMFAGHPRADNAGLSANTLEALDRWQRRPVRGAMT
jgi:hypothetical protein